MHFKNLNKCAQAARLTLSIGRWRCAAMLPVRISIAVLSCTNISSRNNIYRYINIFHSTRRKRKAAEHL